MEQILLTFSTTNNLLEIFDPVILNLMTKKIKIWPPIHPKPLYPQNPIFHYVLPTPKLNQDQQPNYNILLCCL